MSRPKIAMLIAPLALLATRAPVDARTWGERLLDEAARHRPGAAMRIDAVARDGRPIVVARGPSGRPMTTVPLADAMGRPIGTLSATATPVATAAIAAGLSRHLYLADNLTEPDPFVPGALDYPRAQALVDRALSETPDLVTLAMHVEPAGRPNAILASSFGRIGKPADGDDEDVIRGAIRRETTDGGRRLAVELPLLDRSGRTIGALSTSFPVREGRAEAAFASALTLRARLARLIPSLASLTRR